MTPLELLLVVLLLGLLSAVVIPSFRKYLRRSKTSEATMNVRRLYDSAAAYYETEHRSRSGTAVLPPQFPRSAPETPAAGSCCAAADHRCPPAPSRWATPTWQALGFTVEDPHYYSYGFSAEVRIDGAPGAAGFRASARGDLDCDGVYSRFSRDGSVGGKGHVVGPAGLVVTDELE